MSFIPHISPFSPFIPADKCFSPAYPLLLHLFRFATSIGKKQGGKLPRTLRLQRAPHGKRRMKTHATTPHPHAQVCVRLARSHYVAKVETLNGFAKAMLEKQTMGDMVQCQICSLSFVVKRIYCFMFLLFLLSWQPRSHGNT